jgi:hypothetical protein
MIRVLSLTTDDFDSHLKSLMFMCGFFLAVIVAAIWWIRRS